MTNENPLETELAYIRALAEQGSIGPMRNGAYLVAAGTVYAAAAIAQYLAIEGLLPRTIWMSILIWGGATVVFTALSFMFRFNRNAAHKSVGGRAAAAIWSGIGIAIMVFILCLIVIANVLKDFAAVSFLIAPVVLILYGIGWWVGGAISGKAWVKWVAFGSFLTAPLVTLMAGRPEQLLAYAACLVLFTSVPGVFIMRGDKA
jgi:hypothetical protein